MCSYCEHGCFLGLTTSFASDVYIRYRYNVNLFGVPHIFTVHPACTCETTCSQYGEPYTAHIHRTHLGDAKPYVSVVAVAVEGKPYPVGFVRVEQEILASKGRGTRRHRAVVVTILIQIQRPGAISSPCGRL